MGTYLSTPVTDKNVESGESSQLAWGVVDMQGWRKSMEDAHVAHTSPDGQLGVFGVFDGHGGPEVARFCQLYLVSVLEQQETWREQQQQQQKDEADSDDPTFAADGQQQQRHPSHPKETGVGRALVEAFHALDRMIDDPSRRDELTRLGSVKPTTGEQLVASAIPQSPPSPTSAEPEPPVAVQEANNNACFSNNNNNNNNNNESFPVEPAADEQEDGEPHEAPPPPSEDPVDCDIDGAVMSDPPGETVPSVVDQTGPQSEEGSGKEAESNHDDDDDDDDSVEVVGKEEAAMERENDDNDDSEVIEEVHTPLDNPTNSSKVSIMFQRLLNMSNPTGQIVVQLTGQQPGDANNNNAAAIQSPSASLPSLVRNGRLICNLPDHPIHAGATAIVAVFTGRTLTVANAGDSRAVLCRNGTAYPLSFDHKPLHERELSRIRNAGGFVNQFGRVNGNLNLSRSIGDLKYKQVPNISPAEQMITAEPDIVQVELCDQDEFIILGCDGIWDCLTNEKAVAYVRSRIDAMHPTQIGVEVLNEIISEDPRATQGIGGDNMTFMIIDLQPATRSWRRPADAAAAVTPEPVPSAEGNPNETG